MRPGLTVGVGAPYCPLAGWSSKYGPTHDALEPPEPLAHATSGGRKSINHRSRLIPEIMALF
jgi:hypothetical protein